MSMELMVKAMKAKLGNPLRKLVLIKLADNANDKGECWPSYQHIADQCEIGRSTVKSHVRELEKMGFLVRIFRRDGELNKSNIYRLNLDAQGGAGADLVGQELPEGGAGDDLGGGAGADPRTSHSFEPVIEPSSVDADATTGDDGANEARSLTRIPYQQIADLYNRVCGEVLPQCLKLNAKRKDAIRKVWNMEILGEHLFRDLDSWEGYFNDCLQSRHWTGHNDRNWRADIDFLLRESSVLKVLEAMA